MVDSIGISNFAFSISFEELMKSFFKKLSLRSCISLLALFSVACSKGADYRTVLPADSFAVVSFNLASLMAKSNAQGDVRKAVTNLAKMQLADCWALSEEMKAYYGEILDHPTQSGIDFSRAAYVFSEISGTRYRLSPIRYGGVLIPLSDGAKFESVISRVCREVGMEVEQSAGFRYLPISRDRLIEATVICAFNDEACLFFVAPISFSDGLKRVEQLFAQSIDESLLGQPGMTEYLNRNSDMNFLLSFGRVAHMLEEDMLEQIPFLQDMKDAVMLGSLNFEQGQIVFDSSVEGVDWTSDNTWTCEQKGDLLKFLPAETIAAMGLGFNGQKFYSILSSIPGYGMMLGNAQVEQAMSAFQGDVLLNFSGLLPGTEYPSASFLAEVKDKAVVQQLVESLQGMPIVHEKKNGYSLTLGGVKVFFGEKKGVFYITTDETTKSLLDGGKGATLKSREQLFAGEETGLFVDFRRLQSLLESLSLNSGMTDMDSMLQLLGRFDRMEAFGSKRTGKLVIYMTDTQRNALASLWDGVKQLVLEESSSAEH